jgi:hypothetical protein
MDRHYSGKKTLRVPPLIHRNLAIPDESGGGNRRRDGRPGHAHAICTDDLSQ